MQFKYICFLVIVPRSGDTTAPEVHENAASMSMPLMKLYADTVLDPGKRFHYIIRVP